MADPESISKGGVLEGPGSEDTLPTDDFFPFSSCEAAMRSPLFRRGLAVKELKSKDSISVSDFSPFTAEKIEQLSILFDHMLFEGFSSGRLKKPEKIFVDNVTVTMSQLLHHQLSMEDLSLPRLNGRQTGGGLLPSIILQLQEKSGHHGLQKVCNDDNRNGGQLLSTRESWLEVTEQMATGEIKIRKDWRSWRNKKLRQPVEDYAYGTIDYLKLFTEQNGGLVVDDYTLEELDALVDHYNKIKHYYRCEQMSQPLGKVALDWLRNLTLQ